MSFQPEIYPSVPFIDVERLGQNYDTTTVGDTQSPIFTYTMVPAENDFRFVQATIVGYSADNPNSYITVQVQASFKFVAGVLTLMGESRPLNIRNNMDINVFFAINGNDIEIICDGIAGSTIKWSGIVATWSVKP